LNRPIWWKGNTSTRSTLPRPAANCAIGGQDRLVVGQARDEDEADPDRLPSGRQPAGEGERRFHVLPGEVRVPLTPRLEAEENQVDLV
jgi:hypothetical protein